MHPVFVSAKESTINKLKGLKEGIEFYLKQYVDASQDVFVELGSVENTTILDPQLRQYKI